MPQRKQLITLVCLLAVCFSNHLAEAQTELDELSKQASRLEAELGKYNDATPEAADVMIQLTDLYHSDARLFGLVRIGNRFISTHPKDPRHKAVMLKTIDGLQALSRNADLIVACRQFVTQYPNAVECAAIEQRLADTLSRARDSKATSAAYHAIWKRLGNSDTGRAAAVRAIRYYNISGTNHVALGAQLAEDVMDANRDRFAANLGIYSVTAWSKSGNHAQSNRAAAKLLRNSALKSPERRRDIHLQMAENYSRLGQHSSSSKSYAEARKIRDDQPIHSKQLDQLNSGKATAREIEPVARDYASKHPAREDRYRGLMMLVQAHLRENNANAAKALLRNVLGLDALTNNAAQVFVETNGSEPAQLADSERVLRDAINKNSRHAAYLRYTIAFALYRDRIKDIEKTRSTLRELIERSPSSDGYCRTAITWLLDNAKDTKEFNADLTRILKVRQDHPELPAITGFLNDWRQSARRDSKRKERTKLLESGMARADADAVTKLAAQQSFNYTKKESQVRDALLADNLVGKLNANFVNRLLKAQGYYYRRYVANNLRSASATYYGKLAKRLPKDYEAARLWLESATDYSSPEIAAEAAIHLLSFPSTRLDIRYLSPTHDCGREEQRPRLGQPSPWLDSSKPAIWDPGLLLRFLHWRSTEPDGTDNRGPVLLDDPCQR